MSLLWIIANRHSRIGVSSEHDRLSNGQADQIAAEKRWAKAKAKVEAKETHRAIKTEETE